MEQFKVSNKVIKQIVESAESFIESITSDIKSLQNDDADLFVRYMAFNRTAYALKAIEFVIQISHRAMVHGHLVNHDALQTKEAKKNGWDKLDSDNHPLFDKEKDEIPEFIKELLQHDKIDEIIEKILSERKTKE